jgi:hypothetical protein
MLPFPLNWINSNELSENSNSLINSISIKLLSNFIIYIISPDIHKAYS